MKELNELLPCPFCGGPAECSLIDTEFGLETAVGCSEGCAKFCDFNKKVAIEQWNTRAPTSVKELPE